METLPAALYRGSAQYERERAGVFSASWLFVAHGAQLEVPGSYVASAIAGWPLVIVRGPDGEVRAFHNVCPHRAGPIVHDGSGSTTALVCRYHGWSFEPDGRLRGARDFGDGAPGEECSLRSVRAESWRNLWFVNLDAAAPSLARSLGGFAEATDDFDVEGLVPAGEWHHDLACNWKTYAENYLEGYHIPLVHKELARTIDVTGYEVVARDDWCLHRAPAVDGAVVDGRWLWRWPNLALNLYTDAMNLEQFLPLGPATTRVAYRYFSRDGCLDDEVRRVSQRLLAEDAAICEAVQRNLDAGVYDRGVLSAKHEQGVASFQRMIRAATSPF